MNALREFLRTELEQQGPIRFVRFMESALYCPELGYYEQIRHTPGRRGDYFTSVSVGPVFGRLLALQFERWMIDCLENSHSAAPFQILEAGAHDGTLARDLIDTFTQRRPPGWDRLEYWILEPSNRRQRWQRETLGSHAHRVRWVDQWPALAQPRIQGAIFANELLDALPARRLGWDRTRRTWFEWGVDRVGDQLAWVRLPVDPALSQVVQVWLDDLTEAQSEQWADGHTVEAPEAALGWWSAAARSLRSGHLLAIDYGLNGAAWGSPARPQGTLRAYRGHRSTDAVLDVPGEQDLTLHVNWDLVRQVGEAEGLVTRCHLPQGRWLSSLLAQEIAGAPEAVSWTAAELRQFNTLTHPDQMGSQFQVLVQARERQ